MFNMFWNGKPVHFFQERCWALVAGCRENESCSKVLNFLERLDDRIRCTHEETVAIVEPWEHIGGNKSLGCILSEKPADWTNAFKLKISSLIDFYDMLLHGQVWVKNVSKVPGRIREGDIVRAKSNQVREGNGGWFQGRWNRKRRASVLSSLSLSWFSVINVFMSSVHASSCLVRLVTSLRGKDFWSCVSSAKSWWFRVISYDIRERCSVQDKENGPLYWALRHTIHELWWWGRRDIDWSELTSVWEIGLKPLECNRLNAKNRVQVGEENLVVSSVKSCRKIQ